MIKREDIKRALCDMIDQMTDEQLAEPGALGAVRLTMDLEGPIQASELLAAMSQIHPGRWEQLLKMAADNRGLTMDVITKAVAMLESNIATDYRRLTFLQNYTIAEWRQTGTSRSGQKN